MHRTKHPLLLLFLVATAQTINGSKATVQFHVGVLLDAGIPEGITCNMSINIAREDFYSQHQDYTTRLVFHTRNTGDSTVGAASAALDLLRRERVQAIIGPQSSAQAVFVSDLGSATQVPVISFSATNPTLTSSNSPYFIRVASNDSSQVNAISSLVNKYGWREVVPIYDDSSFESGVTRYLMDSLQGVDAHVPYRSELPADATDDRILGELYKLMTMQTRVFVVHTSPPLGSRLFLKANEIGMMGKGYVWIMTDAMTNELDSLDPRTIQSMQGVIGVKQHVERNNVSRSKVSSIYGMWAYDAVWALAKAVEEVRDEIDTQPQSPSQVIDGTIKLKDLPVSTVGPKLRKAILKTRFNGTAGEFHLVNNQLRSSTLEIINICGGGSKVIGFWSPSGGIYTEDRHSDSAVDLDVVWPGTSTLVPKGWQTPTNGKVLRIGVPTKMDFAGFSKVEHDRTTNETKATGFCMDIFEAVLKELPYALSYELVAFENDEGEMAGTYSDLLKEVYPQGLDGVIGDVTITANRLDSVDFTLPYIESGVAMIVPTRKDPIRSVWIFLKPLKADLWLTSLGFCLYTVFVIWVLEHNNDHEFEGPWHKQLGVILYFTFSTLVFSHDLTKLPPVQMGASRAISRGVVVIVWIFVVLVLTTSYTASLTTMLTVAKLEPTVVDMMQLKNNGDKVGYNEVSFLKELLLREFNESKLIELDSPKEYHDALQSGNVSVVFDEIPYISFFLSEYCSGYVMSKPTHQTAGLGFAFPKGSPLVPDISRAILKVTSGDRLAKLEKKWFTTSCTSQDSAIDSHRLTLRTFVGLLLIAGATSAIAVSISIAIFLYEEWDQLRSISRVQTHTIKENPRVAKALWDFQEGQGGCTTST